MNTSFRVIFLVAAFAFVSIRASAGVATDISTNWSGSQAIPDNNPNGVAFSFSVSTDSPLVITNVTVDLMLAGGWNGDLYAYLSHGSGFSVLLNRIGRTAANTAGSGCAGMNVSLSDAFLTDIHTATGNPLTGSFAPDARSVSPFTGLDTDSRNAYLNGFTGLDPNGIWTLFFADASPLSVSTIQSWTVNIGATVPEPGAASLIAMAGLIGIFHRVTRKG